MFWIVLVCFGHMFVLEHFTCSPCCTLSTQSGRDSLYVDDSHGGQAHVVRKSELRPFYDVGETRTLQWVM